MQSAGGFPLIGNITLDISFQQENFAEDICLPQVRLHSIPELSQEQAFSPELSYLPYLGWRMIGKCPNSISNPFIGLITILLRSSGRMASKNALFVLVLLNRSSIFLKFTHFHSFCNVHISNSIILLYQFICIFYLCHKKYWK